MATIMVKGHLDEVHRTSQLIIEPAKTPPPPDVTLIPALVNRKSHILPVKIVNFSSEDVWLCPTTRLGIISVFESVESDKTCDVKFHLISADVEQVFVASRHATTVKCNQS